MELSFRFSTFISFSELSVYYLMNHYQTRSPYFVIELTRTCFKDSFTSTIKYLVIKSKPSFRVRHSQTIIAAAQCFTS